MTRIDDDSSAERRLEEARLADKRAQERQKKQRTEEASAFDRALAARSGETNQRKAFQQSLEKPKPPPDQPQAPPAKDPRAALAARQSGAPSGTTKEAAAAADKALENEMAEIGGQTQNQADKDATARGAERRAPQAKAGQPSADKTPLAAARADARSPGEAKESQSASDQKGDAKSGDASQPTGASTKKGVKRADDDRDSSGKNKDQGSKQDATPTPFRLPPAALMAPPPLARPKDAGGARMSAMTKEIVDKIVSRVLVGHNSAGMAEFRIDLKSSVLKGLSIKVSGGRGKKIRAVFSGTDHDVLEALKDSKSDLIEALEARGLKLEDLAFEET